MKLVDILLEQKEKPKALVMAGGGGAGKSYILDKLKVGGTKVFNPDKYVEDPEHEYYQNLSAASWKVKRDVQDAVDKKQSFVWDTTGTNIESVKNLVDEGYDVTVVMVYTHPIISFLSNFERERSMDKSAVFTTWDKVYDLIEDYRKLLKNNFFLISNLRGGEYDKKIEDFNKAAKKGGEGLLDYINTLVEEEPEKYRSSFSKPFDITDPEALEAYDEEVKNLQFDRSDSNMVKNLKKHFMKSWEKKNIGPGEKSMKTKIVAIERNRERAENTYREVLESIAKKLANNKFSEALKPDKLSTVVDKVNKFFKK